MLSERHQRAVARCVEDIVVYDYVHRKKISMPNFMIDQFRVLWWQQERMQRESIDRVTLLLRRLEDLERASWNREDAVEDMGVHQGIRQYRYGGTGRKTE